VRRTQSIGKKATTGGGEPLRSDGSAVEPVAGMFALRCRPGVAARVRRALAKAGGVHSLPAQNILIVELAGESSPERSDKLQQWQREGLVDFFTPVLRDKQTQLLQILTDEITVRFKPTAPQRRRDRLRHLYGLMAPRQNEFVRDQYVFKIPDAVGLKPLEIAKKLNRAAEVEFAAPNFISEYRR